MTFTFSELAADDALALHEVIGIYQEAIEKSEQKKTDEIATMLSDARYSFLACRKDGKLIGFAISFFPVGADFWLLEYMAVAKAGRSTGIGQELFFEAYKNGAARNGGAVMLLEVDQPGGSIDPSNDTRARMRFYTRVGCRFISGLNYILPLDAAGTPPPMLLLTFRLPSLNAVAKDKVREWLATIYSQVYNQQPTDPRIDKMLSHAPPTLTVLPM